MISRVSDTYSNELPAREWWPIVEADMTMLNISDSRSLMYYILHAKHSKVCDETNIF